MDFGETERYINNLFTPNKEIKINEHNLKILLSGKPVCTKGEPKTDIYVCLEDLSTKKKYELKISFKKSNADFLENKISAERAQSILGTDWKKIIMRSTLQLKEHFENRPLIYKNKKGKTNPGSITLGWKFELVNKPSGDLSSKILLNTNQLLDIYSGNNLTNDKKNAYVRNTLVSNSGVANCMLIGDMENFNNVQAVISNLVFIHDYIKQHPDIYFACKALNYRTFENKFDGNRPLSVWVDWNEQNGLLTPTIIFDSPLTTKGNTVAQKLKNTLAKLNVVTTDDINSNNIKSLSYVY